MEMVSVEVRGLPAADPSGRL